MKRFAFLFILLISVCCLPAAEKEKKPALPKVKTLVKNANTAMKNRSRQGDAERELLGALGREDLSDKSRAEICYVCAELEENLNGVINRQFYLKQKYDTAAFFNYLQNMYSYLERCDSFDAVPDEDGDIHLKYKKRTRSLRLKHRNNMYNGGVFYLSKNDYANAYKFFDYFYTASNEVEDERLPKVAYWAALCGYATEQHDHTLKYIDQAILSAEPDQQPILQEYKARTYLANKNEQAWVAALDTGLIHYPRYDYFFVNKEDWFHSRRLFDDGIHLADSMLTHVDNYALYWYAKCRMELAKNDFEACIAYADSTISHDNKYTNAYYNKGISYLNLAVIAQESASQDMNNSQWQEDRKKVQDLYAKAKPCMEMVRKLEPENTERWGTPLYRIYLHLNMGTEFDEIDKLLKASQKENKG